MQIIESTVYGVRSAIYRLEPRTEGPVFTLFPMIHIGEPEFYLDVSRRLTECDLVLCEGVPGRNVSIITLPYRMAAKNPRLGLVTQHAMDLTQLKGKIINADVSGKAFDERLRSISLWKRLLVLIHIPVLALHARFFLKRNFIAQYMELTLKRSRDEILYIDEDDPWKEIILDWRDERLIGLLEKHRRKPENSNRNIGVLYGAGHMRAVLKYLILKADYRVAKAEWIMAFGT